MPRNLKYETVQRSSLLLWQRAKNMVFKCYIKMKRYEDTKGNGYALQLL